MNEKKENKTKQQHKYKANLTNLNVPKSLCLSTKAKTKQSQVQHIHSTQILLNYLNFSVSF